LLCRGVERTQRGEMSPRAGCGGGMAGRATCVGVPTLWSRRALGPRYYINAIMLSLDI